MSTIYTVDWMQFLNPDSELPTDVTFSVVQSSGTYKGDFVCSVHTVSKNLIRYEQGDEQGDEHCYLCDQLARNKLPSSCS